MAGAPPSTQLGARLTSIHELPARIAGLEGAARERARRLIDARLITAAVEPIPDLEPWLTRTFGSVDAVRHQRITRVTNLATGEATIFAPLRARRPLDGGLADRDEIARQIAATERDPFCDPERGTPAHSFGRVRGRHMISGANAAAADAHHAVLVFDRHDPLDVDADLIADLLDTGRAWAEAARASDPASVNYLLIWNCLWRAGGSIVHGHAQALLGPGPRDGRLERFRRDAAAYRAEHGSDLLPDLVALHADLGLAATRDGVATLAHLTPIKEHEIVVIGPAGMDERDPAFAAAVARAVLAFRDRIGVRSFNLALWRPPLVAEPGWDGFGPVVRMTDRGDLAARASDIGAVELYATPIVASDPYEVMAALG